MSKYIIAVLISVLAMPASASPTVLSSIYPLQQIANAIVGKPTGLVVDSYLSPHQYSIKPSEARRINDADILVWVGDVMMPQLEKYINNRHKQTITAAKLPQIQLLAADPHHHHHHAEAESEHHDEDEEEHMAYDPHMWLSSDNAKVIAEAIAHKLIAQDPTNTARYQNNLQKFKQQMDALKASIKLSFEHQPPSKYFVFHNAYRYFEHEFGVKSSGVIREHAEQSPKTRHLSELKNQIDTSSKACVFREPQFNSPIVKNLVADTSQVSVSVLDPIGYQKNKQIGYSAILLGIADKIIHCQSAGAAK